MVSVVLLALCTGVLAAAVGGMLVEHPSQDYYERLAAIGFMAGGGAVAALIWLAFSFPPR